MLKFLSYLLLFALIFGGLALGALQLPFSKNFVSGEIINAFNEQYNGSVAIGSMEGFIPFKTQLNDVRFYPGVSSNSTSNYSQTPLSVEEIFISIDIWQLIRGNINITELDLRSPDLILHREESGLTIVNLFTRSSPSEPSGQAGNFIKNFSIFAPQISLLNGQVVVDKSVNTITDYSLPDSLILTNLDASFFVESLDMQQFIEVNSFTAQTNVEDFNDISMNGQLFTNGVSLELNRLDRKSVV